jgi:hypothetical protein
MNYKKSLSKFINDYIKLLVKEDYKLKVDLTYSYYTKSEKVSRKWIKNLKNYLKSKDVRMEGIYVNELNKSYELHNHMLIWVDCDWSYAKSLIYNYWHKIGSLKIDKYNKDLNYTDYMVKHINVNEANSWEFLENL